MENVPPQERSLVTVETHADKIRSIDAVCLNCNKRLKSMRSVSMHLRMTGTHHTVNFISYGNYDKKTGLREVNRTGVMEEISVGTHTIPAVRSLGQNETENS
jgi:hypothetical protein